MNSKTRKEKDNHKKTNTQCGIMSIKQDFDLICKDKAAK